MGFRDVAGLYLSNGLLPLPVKEKRPPVGGATGLGGSVTPQAVYDWMADPEWRDQNVALRPSGWVGIDVDNYGTKEGAKQLAQLEAHLGPLPVSVSSTARGIESGSRQIFFEIPGGIKLRGQAASDIEIIQAHHRYSIVWPSIHPETGGVYAWYDADDRPMAGVPALDDFERLPAAWIEYLLAPEIERESATDTTYAATGMTDGEQAKLGIIKQSLLALPRVWSPGDNWHNVVFANACWLARIANTSAYVTDHEAAKRLLLEYTPTWENWGPEQVLLQWNSAVKSNEGHYAEAPISNFQPLPALDSLAQIPAAAPLLSSISERPIIETPASLATARTEIANAAIDAGLSEAQAAALVWNSAAAMELTDQPSGLSSVWAEVRSASLRAVAHIDIKSELYDPTDDDIVRPAKLELDEPVGKFGTFPGALTAEEREYLEGPGGVWWGTRYISWVQSRVPVYNAPYHRSMLWTILSLYWANVALIPKKRKYEQLNIWTLTTGPTTSGKSEAFNLGRQVIKECFPGASPNIGGNMTVNGLIERLIDRDGTPSWFNSDEAHGLFALISQKKGNNVYAGLKELLANVFDGDVPVVQFATKKEISGKEATTHFVAQLTGTTEGMMDILTEGEWESGLLPRFVWEIGERIQVDDSVYNEDDEDPNEVGTDFDYGGMPRQWAAEFAQTRQRLAEVGPFPLRAWLEPDAKLRFEMFKRQLGRWADRHADHKMVMPSSIRLMNTTRKAATLIALTEGTPIVNARHILIAIEQAEHWIRNLEIAARATMLSDFARNVDQIEQYIEAGNAAARDMRLVYRHANAPKVEVDRAITQLVAEGRVRRWHNVIKGRDFVQIEEGRDAH